MSGSNTRKTMYDKFQPWVLATYGDSAKTKTITTKKAKRIVKLLQAKEKDGTPGPEPAGSEGAKFRLWVKSKGLTLSRGPGAEAGTASEAGDAEDTSLYLPTGTEQSLDGKVQFVFKKVAVVEKFFDIIYSVHVESESGEAPHLRGRAGKHCGQKRTYRAIADQYAFIPREAISRFLTFCSECQRKQPPHSGARNKGGSVTSEQQLDAARDGPLFYKPPLVTPPATPPSLTEANSGAGAGEENTLAASLRRALQQQQQDPARCGGHSGLGSGVSSVSRGSLGSGAGLLMAAGSCHQGTPEPASGSANNGVTILPVTAENLAKLDNSGDIDLSFPITSTYLRQMRHRPMELASAAAGAEPEEEDDEDNDDLNIHDDGEDSPVASQGAWPAFSSAPASASLKPGPGLQVSALGQLLGGQNTGNIASMSPVRSDMSRDESIVDDTSSVGNKEDDEDDEEDGNDDEKFEGMSGDPERLKAFNMFVRLFVDENLDRHVPISKQPKEKIQAIIDSCTRQFPEYSERARKRIRTYLKSCRRTKRSREQAGLDINNRPTPPHLTSVLAEQLLARACENEAENAKRMRMGMEPVSQALPSSLLASPGLDTMPSPPQLSLTSATKMDYKSEQLVNLLSASAHAQSNGAGLQISGTGSPAPVSGPQHPAISQSPQMFGVSSVGLLDGAGVVNGQNSIDGLKKAPILNHKLNGTEISAVRQLITGYRESAAFLLRSADELEHLIQIQTKL